ncbi:MAG: ribulose-phosphate 3-epimerase [Candidatus Aminicenantales bacterium]
MTKIIVPAVIARDQDELDGILSRIADHAQLIQLDVMDGRFVPNHSLDFDFQLPGKKYAYEAHLMVQDPELWVEKYAERVDTIIAHLEATRDPAALIEEIKRRSKRAALALNPETGIERIMDHLEALDQVLVMTVHPGAYGSPFLPEMREKIRRLRRLRPFLDIEVDGGIKPDTIALVDAAGANMFVSGSYLVKGADFQERMEILTQKISSSP